MDMRFSPIFNRLRLRLPNRLQRFFNTRSQPQQTDRRELPSPISDANNSPRNHASILRKKITERIKTGFKHPIVQAAGFGIAALWLGANAFDSAGNYSLRQWHNRHRPSRELWGWLAGNYKFSRIEQPDERDRVLKRLGVSTDKDGTVWIGYRTPPKDQPDQSTGELSQDFPIEWIVYFDNVSTGEIKIYRRPGIKKLSPELQWQRIGQGWEALETVLAGLGNPDAYFEPIQTQKTAKSAVKSDPREIRY